MPYFNQMLLKDHDKRWLDDAELVNILPKTPIGSSVEILAPADIQNIDNSLGEVLKQAAKSDCKHVMFPVGPNHWYLVKISKGTPYTVEVFDPKNHDVSHIFSSLRPVLNAEGIHNYREITGKFKKPQCDSYACGYFVAAKAHELLLNLEPKAQAVCHQQAISILNAEGNHNNSLRDAFSSADTVKQKTTHPIKQPSIVTTHPEHESLLNSYFRLKDHIKQTAQEIKANKTDESSLTDSEVAYLLQAEEFSKLKR